MKKAKKEYKPSRGRILLWGIPLCILFIIGVAATSLSVWYRNTFSIPFKDLLYTLLSPLEGTGQTTIHLILWAVLPYAGGALLLSAGALVFFALRYRAHDRLRRIAAGVGAGVFLFGLGFTFFSMRMDEYVSDVVQNVVDELPIFNPGEEKKSFYETYYVDPAGAVIHSPENPKNLICIYLESMETTYATEGEGGSQKEINYIPNLTAMAKANLSFSDSTALGGFRCPDGTAWTMGSLLATTSGIPYSLAVFGEQGHNNLGNFDHPFPGITTIGDILAERGYVQEFLCGSKASFAGRDKYFREHGNYRIYDLNTAYEEGYAEEGYYVWWGIEDMLLYQIARDEVTRLASGDAPFNFTMLTVDTHHVDGYICRLCGDEYSRTGNVVACADRQAYAFIEWCQAQPFYKDTVIVVIGDHPRMDTSLVKGVDPEERTMYNCFLNAAATPQGSTVNRDMTPFDIFPTTLAAMGFTIEGDRLGLGTNLFSARPTLSEEKGYRWLDREIGKYHEYYVDKFLHYWQEG